jgi:hypothetical protein
MKICELENFKFTSKYLWAAFLVSFPWAPLAIAELINPHHDITGLFIPLSVIISIVFIVISIVKKEKQTLFLFIDAIVVMFIMPLPFICIAPH